MKLRLVIETEVGMGNAQQIVDGLFDVGEEIVHRAFMPKSAMGRPGAVYFVEHVLSSPSFDEVAAKKNETFTRVENVAIISRGD